MILGMGASHAAVNEFLLNLPVSPFLSHFLEIS